MFRATLRPCYADTTLVTWPDWIKSPMVSSLFALEPVLPALTSGELIITANDRLRRHLLKAWHQRQQNAGAQAWEAPRVQSLGRWQERQWQTLVERGHPNCQSLIAERPACQLIWETIIAQSEAGQSLLQAEPLAREAEAARRNLRLWQLDPGELLETTLTHSNGETFHRWLSDFGERLASRELITPEDAQAIVIQAFTECRLNREPRLWLLGFDDLAPLDRQLLNAACDQLQTLPSRSLADSQLLRTLAPDPDTEIRAAALWSRTQLEQNPDSSIGIIVPDLGQQRGRVERLFAEIFEPQTFNPHSHRHTLPFNLSAGTPLSDTAPVDAALQLLGLLRDQWPLSELCQLLNLPFWSEPEEELVLRSQLAEALRAQGKFNLRGSDLRHWCQLLSEQQPNSDHLTLAQRLQQLDQARRRLPATQSPSRWAGFFREQLDVLGWLGPRRLDSEEYQQVAQWHEALETFSRLDLANDAFNLSQALRHLHNLLRQTPFQAQTPDSPIQILGALEGAGLAFSHCWVVGLHQRQWPPAPTPNPLLPLDLQRREQMPHATAERELHYAQSLTDQYRGCAPQVVFSCASTDEQGELSPSPLIAELPETPLDALLGDRESPLEAHRRQLAHSARLEALDCARGPALDISGKAPGGSSLFKLQAACPFNAFAQLRLGARAPDKPVLGLSPAERGTALHSLLAAIWQQLGNSERLAAQSDAALAELVKGFCGPIIESFRKRRPREIGPVYASLEAERLQELALRWLALEKQRPAFEVEAIEARREIDFAGLKLTLFIDRIDRLASGERLLIDYKTSAQLSTNQWLGERPDEPQLPLYAVTQEAEVQGLAFAQLNPKALQWIGLGELHSPLSGLRPARPDWSSQLQEWQSVLRALAEGFVQGDARVDFKDQKAQDYSTELLPLNRAPEAELVQAVIARDLNPV